MFLRFFLLQSLLLAICMWCGKRIAINKDIYRNAFIIILAFSLIEGLRWGRGIDYNIYVGVYDSFLIGDPYMTEAFLFDLLLTVMAYLNLPYQFLIIFSSFLLIICGMKWMMKYPEIMFFSVPWFYILTFSAENLFRWYIAAGFLLVAITEFLDEKRRKALVYTIISVGFHPMMALLAILFLVLSFKKNILIVPLGALCIYIGISVVWSTDFMRMLVPFANYVLSNSEKYSSHYGTDVESWLVGDVNEMGDVSTFRIFLDFILCVFLLFKGAKIAQKKRELMLYYNIMAMGLILSPAMKSIELCDRFNQIMLIFQCIIGGYCLKDSICSKKKKGFSLVLSLFIILILGQNTFKRLTPTNKYYTYYIWDANGKKNLSPHDLDTY